MKKQRKAHWIEISLKHTDYYWEKRIAVDLECNPILCVHPDYEKEYLNWESYCTIRWHHQWREIKEPEYVPYETMEECFEDLKDVWVRYKNTPGSVNKIIQFHSLTNTCKLNDWNYGMVSLFHNFEKLDGTPCGKLKE